MFKSVLVKTKQFISRNVLRKNVEPSIFYTGARLNIGDSMVPWLVSNVSGKKLQYSNPLSARGPHLFSIGSILQYANPDCDVWGSGFISATSRCKGKPRSVAAVRGPLTARRLAELYNIEVNTFGDPALLTPLFLEIENNDQPRYKVGIVPHYIDKNRLAQINDSDIKIIDVETDDIKSFVCALIDCEVILSSSLHGLILAEAFGRPAVWIEFSDSVVGSGFKFRDYYLSTSRDVSPVKMTNKSDFLEVASKQTSTPPSELILEIQQNLIKSFPQKYMNL